MKGRLFARSFLLQAGFSDERLQAFGFSWAIDPALRRAYAADAAGLAAARARHVSAFNCQPCAAGLVLGVTAFLESRIAAGETGLEARVAAWKSSLSAALSGSADAFFWGALRPLAAAAGVLVAVVAWRAGVRHPFAWGAAAGLAIFNVPATVVRWLGVSLGLSRGEASAAAAASLPVQGGLRVARLATLAAIAAAFLTCLPFVPHGAVAALALAAGAGLSRRAGGPWRLVAAAGALGAAAAAAGWRP